MNLKHLYKSFNTLPHTKFPILKNYTPMGYARS